MLVYHGTTQQFDQFKPSKGTGAIYFFKDKKLAASFAKFHLYYPEDRAIVCLTKIDNTANIIDFHDFTNPIIADIPKIVWGERADHYTPESWRKITTSGSDFMAFDLIDYNEKIINHFLENDVDGIWAVDGLDEIEDGLLVKVLIMFNIDKINIEQCEDLTHKEINESQINFNYIKRLVSEAIGNKSANTSDGRSQELKDLLARTNAANQKNKGYMDLGDVHMATSNKRAQGLISQDLLDRRNSQESETTFQKKDSTKTTSFTEEEINQLSYDEALSNLQKYFILVSKNITLDEVQKKLQPSYIEDKFGPIAVANLDKILNNTNMRAQRFIDEFTNILMGGNYYSAIKYRELSLTKEVRESMRLYNQNQNIYHIKETIENKYNEVAMQEFLSDNIPQLKKNTLIRILGIGSFKIAFLLDNDHVLSIARGGFSQKEDPLKPFKDIQNRMFSGKGSIHDIAVYDYGYLEGDTDSGDNYNNPHYIEMSQVIPLEVYVQSFLGKSHIEWRDVDDMRNIIGTSIMKELVHFTVDNRGDIDVDDKKITFARLKKRILKNRRNQSVIEDTATLIGKELTMGWLNAMVHSGIKNGPKSVEDAHFSNVGVNITNPKKLIIYDIS